MPTRPRRRLPKRRCNCCKYLSYKLHFEKLGSQNLAADRLHYEDDTIFFFGHDNLSRSDFVETMDHRCNPPQIPAMIEWEMTSAMFDAFNSSPWRSLEKAFAASTDVRTRSSSQSQCNRLHLAYEAQFGNHAQLTFTTKFVMPHIQESVLKYETFLRCANLMCESGPRCS
jgi:hypothetical protein